MASRIKAIVRKEARESLWKFWLAAGLLVVVGGSLGPMYGFLGGLLPQLNVELLPGWIRNPLMQQLYNYRVYLWANWYGKNLYQMIALLTLIFGSGLIAGEVGRGTAGFLFSKPVRRPTVIRAKYGVALAVLWISTLLGTAATLIGSRWAGRPVDLPWFLGGLPAAMAGSAVLLAMTTVVSALSKDTVKAAAAAAVAYIAISVTGLFRPVRWLWVFGHMSAVSTLVSGRVDWLAAGAMLVAAGLFVACAEWLLGRRDV